MRILKSWPVPSSLRISLGVAAIAGWLWAGPLAAQTWQGPISLGIQVTDSDGAAVVGAEVEVQYAETDVYVGPPPGQTDSAGRLEVHGLAEGLWKVRVTREGFSASTVVVRVDVGKKKARVVASLREGPAPPLNLEFVKSEAAGAVSQRVAEVREEKGKKAKKEKKKERGGQRISESEPEELAPVPRPRIRPVPPPPPPARPEPTPEPVPEATPEPTSPKPTPEPVTTPSPAPTPPPAAPAPEPAAPQPAAPQPSPVEAEPAPASPPAAPPPAAAEVEPEPTPELVPAPSPEPVERAEPTPPPPAPPSAPEPVVEAPAEPSPETSPEPSAAAAPEPLVSEKPAPEPPAPEPTAVEPAAPPVETAPAAAPAPTPPPAASPEPAPAPSPRPRAVSAPRTYRDKSCSDCKPGEAAVSAIRYAAAGDGSCPSGWQQAVREAVHRLTEDSGSRLSGYTGALFLGAAGSEQLAAVASEETLKAVEELLAPWTDPASDCQLLGVVLDPGVKFTGYRYEARDGSGASDCLAGQDCPLGAAVWADHPRVEKTPQGTFLWALFQNRSPEQIRRSEMTVYFDPTP